MKDGSLTLPSFLAWPMVVGGLLAVFATYWDEAWHTDVGRDSALAAPHLLLYGSVAAIGLGIARFEMEVSGRQITMSTAVVDHCDDLAPRRLVARRAGEEVTADLRQTGDGCDFEGTLEVPSTGRWFTYAELTHDGALVEAWLPAIAGESSRTTQMKALYEPAGAGDGMSPAQVVAGVLIYGLGAAVVVVALLATRRPVTMNP